MPLITAIQLSIPQELTQNTVYALPARACRVLSSQTLEVTSGTTGGTYVAVTGANLAGGVDISGTFVRNTNATTAAAVFKPY